MGDKIDLISLCDGFIKYTQTTISYLVKATQECIKTLTEPHSTQSETESIFLYLLTQTLLNLTQYTDKNLPNKNPLIRIFDTPTLPI